jgi:hypothetical protein
LTRTGIRSRNSVPPFVFYRFKDAVDAAGPWKPGKQVKMKQGGEGNPPPPFFENFRASCKTRLVLPKLLQFFGLRPAKLLF